MKTDDEIYKAARQAYEMGLTIWDVGNPDDDTESLWDYSVEETNKYKKFLRDLCDNVVAANLYLKPDGSSELD